jgi:MFS superfamily sulfate permease-like transporter
MKDRLRTLGADLPASVVVYLVALPLCLGIAVASDAQPVTGIIAGAIGGIVIGFLSGSPLSVSGPAAGLTSIVAASIAKLGSYETFLLSVLIAGLMQIGLGYLKAGVIGDFVPNSVIKGMLAAIGIILILKQFPHFVGYDSDPEGDFAFVQADKSNTLSSLFRSIQQIEKGALIIALASSTILLLYEQKFVKKLPFIKLLPGPLLVVAAGILINLLFIHSSPDLVVSGEHLVQIDSFQSPLAFFQSLPSPNFASIIEIDVWITGLTIALVASLESLLSVEAIDKIDPAKRITPTNRELKAQGVGNMVSGMLGGLPVTSVIVRSSANLNAGAKSKTSAIIHGIMLLSSVLFFPNLLNLIPKSCLAAILIFTGYKLAKIPLFTEHYKKGQQQFLPFVVTILAILFTDLLIGIAIGIAVGLFFVIRGNFKSAIFYTQDEYRALIRFKKEVSFMNKANLKRIFEKIPDTSAVLIDATKSVFIDRDIIDMVNDFIINAETRGIRIYIKYSGTDSKTFFNDIARRKIE